MALPVQYWLNGLDKFLAELDGVMLRTHGRRNVCYLKIELQSPLDSRRLQQHLETQPQFRWIHALRLVAGLPMTIPRWRELPKPPALHISETVLAAGLPIPDAMYLADIDPIRAPPVRVSVVQRGHDRTTLLFAWHHALLDAHGAEMLVQQLFQAASDTQTLVVPDPAGDTTRLIPRLAVWREARDIGIFLRDVCGPTFISLHRERAPPAASRYEVLTFEKEAKERIDAMAASLGAATTHSAFYLAAVARAIARVDAARGSPPGDMLIPVPHDLRRKGSTQVELANHVTFLFYRLSVQDLQSLRATIVSINRQTLEMIRADRPRQYIILSGLLRRMPSWLYRQMLQSSKQGLASFFFSDTGTSLDALTDVLGIPVRNACHFPPNTTPPGITFIFSRFRGDLQLTMSYEDGILTGAEIMALKASLWRELTGAAG